MAPDAYRESFCALHRSFAPVAAFEDIPHWLSVARSLLPDARSYEKRKVYVASGHFYAIDTPVPPERDLASAVQEAKGAGAQYLLYPCIRHTEDRSLLVDRGFIPFPWFFESVYAVRSEVDEDLRAQLGSRYAREGRRQLRKHRLRYAAETYFCGDLPAHPWVLGEFDRLHRKNLEKYGHATNFYSQGVLARLLHSSLGESLFFYFSRNKGTGRATQALLGTLDEKEARMQMLVQGIDPGTVEPGDSVYFSSFLDLYHLGRSKGIREFRLGRGAPMIKRRVGANRFYVLHNYLKPIDPAAYEEDRPVLQELRENAEKKTERELQALMAEGKGENYSFPTSWK